MSKCNNCTKFLTCNRETCKQVTYLQAGQIDKVEANWFIASGVFEIASVLSFWREDKQ